MPPACGSRRDGSPELDDGDLRPRASAGARGRPIWLFRFPLFLKTGKRPARNSATTSLVVVLPALPVIATTVAGAAANVTGEILQRAGRVFDLDERRCRRSCLGRHRRLVDHRADGPTSSGIAHESMPVKVSPAIATKKSPGSSERESIDTRPMRSRGRPGPPVPGRVGHVTCAQGQPLHLSAHPGAGAPPFQRSSRDFDVVERQPRSPITW